MTTRKKIFVIIGSTRAQSSNLKLVQKIEAALIDNFDFVIYESLSALPHFNPDLDNEQPPAQVVELRKQIAAADGILICTPEYVFSLPGSLKNAIEWCVSTTVFSKKPIGLITASASGEKAHEELQLIMKTVETIFTEETTLLIRGIKGKFDDHGNIKDADTQTKLNIFIASFEKLVHG